MPGKVLPFDPDRRRGGAGEHQTATFRPPEDEREDSDTVTEIDEDEAPRGLLSIVSIRILADDDPEL